MNDAVLDHFRSLATAMGINPWPETEAADTLVRSGMGKFLVVDTRAGRSDYWWTDDRAAATRMSNTLATRWERKFEGAYRVAADPQV